MTIDDESFLSAYMDGQLSLDQQQAVESALIADPQLGEELRRLTLVRDLVAGLSRDVPVEVSSRVRRRVRGRSRLRRILAGPAGSTYGSAASGLGRGDGRALPP